MALFVAAALGASAIVAISLNEQAELLRQNQKDRATERSYNAIHEATVVLLQAMSVISTLGLDLTQDESRNAVVAVDKLMGRFESLHFFILDTSGKFWSDTEQDRFARAVSEVQRSWWDITQDFGAGDRNVLVKRLQAIREHTEIVRELILKLDYAVRANASAAKDALIRRAEAARQFVVACLLIGVVLLIGVGWLSLDYGVRRPLKEVTSIIGRLADGDLGVAVPERNRNDEIGEIMAALAVFREHALARQQLEADKLKDAADRDARRERLETRIGEFRADVLDALESNGEAIAVMRQAAEQLNADAARNRAGAGVAAGASQTVSNNIADVATAAGQLSDSFGEMSQRIMQAENAISQAAARATTASEMIDGLVKTAETIDDVARFIETIARQTNLLALNATIEAARAGAAGRGFAVVATEVKQLASETGKATENIAARIDEVRSRTAKVVGAIRVITRTSAEASAHASAISSSVAEQQKVTETISRTIRDVAGGTSGLHSIVASVATAVGRTAQAAHGVNAASDASSAATERLRKLIDEFLANVRAA